MARQRIGYEPVGVRRQSRVGMQEQQSIAAGGRGTAIHLGCTPARGDDDPLGMARALHGVVGAAAVDDDALGTAGGQWREGEQRRDDIVGLVQGRMMIDSRFMWDTIPGRYFASLRRQS